MVVTSLEEIDKNKFKVYIDYHYAFLLYRKDIEVYGLKEEEEITDWEFDKIIEDTVLRRAKQKALAILKFKDRTEQELRGKLSETGYPPEVIDRTITYVMEYGYLNDERFVGAFIRERKNTKSKMVIRMQLVQKGAKKELIDHMLQLEYEESEEGQDAEVIAIQRAIAKKTKNIDGLNFEEKQKIVASLYRKGFSIEKIKSELK